MNGAWLQLAAARHSVRDSYRTTALCELQGCNVPLICLSVLVQCNSFACLLNFLFPSVYASLKIVSFHFQAGCHKRQPNLIIVFLCLLCVVVYFVADAFFFCCV